MSVGSVAFDQVDIARRLDTLDGGLGATMRNLQSSWALAQAVQSVARGLAAPGAGSYTLGEDWKPLTSFTGVETGRDGSDATPIQFTLKNVPVVADATTPRVRITLLDNAGLPQVIVDDGVGPVGTLSGGELTAGTITYATGAVDLTSFSAAPQPGAISIDFDWDSRAAYEAEVDAVIASMTGALAALKILVQA